MTTGYLEPESRERLHDMLGLDHETGSGELLRHVEQLVADVRDPKRDEAYIYRVADVLGIDREVMTGSYGIRQIEQLVRERDTFRAQLDSALVPLVKRARKLRLDDLLYDVESGRIGVVKRVVPDAFGVTLDVLSLTTGKVRTGLRYDHPDEEVTVLMALVERDGLLLLRKSLGVQLVDYDPDQPTGEVS
jgi:hypothetical protein